MEGSRTEEEGSESAMTTDHHDPTEDLEPQFELEAEDFAGPIIKKQQQKGPVKEYDVRAKESQYSRLNEELVYQNSRKKKLGDMDKKQRHLFLFTNFD